MSVQTASVASVVFHDHMAPVDCYPWCSDGSGHENAFHPEDQICDSETVEVPLTAMELDSWVVGDVRHFGLLHGRAMITNESGRPLFRISSEHESGISLRKDEAIAFLTDALELAKRM